MDKKLKTKDLAAHWQLTPDQLEEGARATSYAYSCGLAGTFMGTMTFFTPLSSYFSSLHAPLLIPIAICALPPLAIGIAMAKFDKVRLSGNLDTHPAIVHHAINKLKIEAAKDYGKASCERPAVFGPWGPRLQPS